MVIYDVNDKLKIIYTPNKKTDFDKIFKILDINLESKSIKNIEINQSGRFFPVGGTAALDSIEIKDTEKNSVTHIINDIAVFDYDMDNIPLILDKLKTFGNKYTININNRLFRGDFYRNTDTSIKNTSGQVIFFETDPGQKMTLRIHDFMHKMRMNNSRMIMPLIRKYADVITICRGKKHLLTGYANILNYLEFMKNPSRDFIKSLAGEEGDCKVLFVRGRSRITLRVSGVLENSLMLDFLINNEPYVAGKMDTESPVPYILLNTKPIQLLNQKLIYFTAKYKNTTVFVIPLMLKSDDALKNLRGGFNLLS